MKRIYLSGPIYNCTHEELHGWREFIKSQLDPKDYEFFDPTRRSYSVLESIQQYKKLVEYDKTDIAISDVVLVNYEEPKAGSKMTGTTMEILYGWSLGKLVITIASKSVSPWIIYHSSIIVPDMRTAIKEIKEYFN